MTSIPARIKNLPNGNVKADTKKSRAVGKSQATVSKSLRDSKPRIADGPTSTNGNSSRGTKDATAVGSSTSAADNSGTDTNCNRISGGTTSTNGNGSSAAKSMCAAGGKKGAGSKLISDTKAATAASSLLTDDSLNMTAEVVDDLEKVRCANENRLRALTTPADKLGFGLDINHPDVAVLSDLVDRLLQLEKEAIKNLERTMRRHPLWEAFGKNIIGVGEKQFARLLAVIQDPYWNDLHERPRKRGELVAYCGVHVLHPEGNSRSDTNGTCTLGMAPTRRRGVQANWNETARKRLWLIASQTIRYDGKDGHPLSYYRHFYDEARAKYADATHDFDCVRCGPSGNPALVGSPLNAGHQSARAIRKVMHEILNDLWKVAKELHEAQE